jgi:nucleotide-binding universal stress UspA family protein
MTDLIDTTVNTARGPHVLIAVDDSETSVRAAHTAYRLFGDDARYTVINVATNQTVLWGEDALHAGMVYPLALPGAGYVGAVPFQVVNTDPDEAATERADDAERRADDIAREAGIPAAEALGDTGDAADAIVAAAHHHHADVIVVGSHDRNWFARLFTGSVSKSVMRDADVPVLIAR